AGTGTCTPRCSGPVRWWRSRQLPPSLSPSREPPVEAPCSMLTVSASREQGRAFRCRLTKADAQEIIAPATMHGIANRDNTAYRFAPVIEIRCHLTRRCAREQHVGTVRLVAARTRSRSKGG